MWRLFLFNGILRLKDAHGNGRHFRHCLLDLNVMKWNFIISYNFLTAITRKLMQKYRNRNVPYHDNSNFSKRTRIHQAVFLKIGM